MATLTKTFITEFKKQVLCIPNEINDLDDGVINMCKINDNITFNGYVRRDDVLMLICSLGRKSLQKSSYYINQISNSDLFGSDFLISTRATYFLIYKNKNSYLVFYYDYKEADKDEISLKPNFKLSQFSEIFSDSNTINDCRGIRSEVEYVIRSIYGNMKCGSNNRTIFIILTWILLKNDDIEFTTLKNGKTYSLSQYLDFLWEHSQKFTSNPDEWEKERDLFDDVDGWTLVEAFNRIITRKIKHDPSVNNNHSNNSMCLHTESVKKQIGKFKELINSIQNKQTKEYAISLAAQIYNEVFKKYGRDIDMNKLAFELENQWNNRTLGNQVAAKGQIYTHTMMKDLIMKIFKDNITPDSTCYDPTCGTGGFCESFYKLCETNVKLYSSVTAYGNEIDNDCSNLAWINGLNSNVDVRVFNYDCFDPEVKDELIPTNSIDFLLMNPPFGMNKGKFLGMPKGFHWEEDADQKRVIKPTEWTFCRYNLESFVKQGGWFAFVIPISCVSENKQNNYDKARMIETCEIWFVIKIREDIFTPQAGKACCLVIGRYVNGWRTKHEIETWKTKCVDFSQDGGEIKRKKSEVEYDKKELEKLWMERILDNKCLDGICEKAGGEDEILMSILYEDHMGEDGGEDGGDNTNDNTTAWYEERVLKFDDNWIYRKREKVNLKECKLEFYNSIEERRHVWYMNKLNEVMNSIVRGGNVKGGSVRTNDKVNANGNDSSTMTDDKNEFDSNVDANMGSSCITLDNPNLEWRSIGITELFEFVKIKNKENINKCNEGPYPLIGQSSLNNGIVKYIDHYEFDTTDPLISVSHDNGGFCFIQKGKFAMTEKMHLLKLTDEYKHISEHELRHITFLMTQKFTKTYSY
ncbi:MAG: N-6 DNA methylase, partial [Patescibacteria group bacterium]